MASSKENFTVKDEILLTNSITGNKKKYLVTSGDTVLNTQCYRAGTINNIVKANIQGSNSVALSRRTGANIQKNNLQTANSIIVNATGVSTIMLHQFVTISSARRNKTRTNK